MFIDGIPSHKHFCLDLVRLGWTLRNSGPSLHLEDSSHLVNDLHDLLNFAIEIFNKKLEHLLPTSLLRYEVYTYGKLISRRTQRPYLSFLRKLRKFWFDHNIYLYCLQPTNTLAYYSKVKLPQMQS